MSVYLLDKGVSLFYHDGMIIIMGSTVSELSRRARKRIGKLYKKQLSIRCNAAKAKMDTQMVWNWFNVKNDEEADRIASIVLDAWDKMKNRPQGCLEIVKKQRNAISFFLNPGG